MEQKFKIIIFGGAGYVGSELVPKLLASGHLVTVVDLMIYGDSVLKKHPNLIIEKGDIRNIGFVKAISWARCGNSPGLYFQRSKF